MARITQLQPYSVKPTVPQPEVPVAPHIVRVRDGVPVVYPDCEGGVGVRVVHPSNPKAPSQNLAAVMFFVAPHGSLPVGSHETEEVYIILEGQGTGTIGGQTVALEKGMFIHLPPWCEHGLENTGDEPLVILICTAPPNP